MARVLAVLEWIEMALLAQRGHLFGWAPVCLATGIGGYFALRFEPDRWWLAAMTCGVVLVLVVYRQLPEAVAPLVMGVAIVLFGVILASVRAHTVAGPVLAGRYYGPVEGRVIALDRSVSGALRVTLDQVFLAARGHDPAPLRVRIALHSKVTGHAPAVGQRVMLTANLSPPPRAVEPGGFDFRRHAWFQRLGAIGYARVPLMLLEPGQGPLIDRLRATLSRRILAVLPGDTGAVAVALITGDRGALPDALIEDLRRSNLAHLLAISGLHMGLVSGFVFALLRLALVSIPWVALHWPVKKIAAGGALICAGGYLALSGGAIATERAFIMAAMVLIAVMLDHRALTLRAVALAALIVLFLRPEVLVSPGFQMSFAATTSLVVVFSVLRGIALMRVPVVGGAVTLFISSAVAGLATAPIAAAHFNMMSQLGLLANLATVPLMGVFIMPAAVLGVLLMPFGAEAAAFWAMGLGIDWVLAVAQRVSDHPQAVRYIATPDSWVLPTLVLGVLVVFLWSGRARFLGVLVVIYALAGWGGSPRPDLLIADQGVLVGVMTTEGRALSSPRGAGFIAEVWLENDGAPKPQADAASRWPQEVPLKTGYLYVAKGKRAARDLRCQSGDWIVTDQWRQGDLPCLVWDRNRLSQTGSVAVYDLSGSEQRIVTERDLSGDRLWSNWPKDQ